MVETRGYVATLDLDIDVEFSGSPFDQWANRSDALAGVALSAATPEQLLAIADVRPRAIVGVVNPDVDGRAASALAADMGLIAVEEVRPLLAAIGMRVAGIDTPWLANTMKLSAADRHRLTPIVDAHATKQSVKLVSTGSGIEAYAGTRRVLLGDARDVGDAIESMIRAHGVAPTALAPQVDSVAARAQEILFGPRRSLSDPASKSALRPYGLIFPREELCTSPSRVAAEAGEMGFPVRIALASPDLRVWDHPDLAVDGVDNAARARDVYRQLVQTAEQRLPGARILGVTVSSNVPTRALLRAVFHALPKRRVLARLGFADAHGNAAGDETTMLVPTDGSRIEHIVRRLSGCDLLLEAPPGIRRDSLDNLHATLLRTATFVADHSATVEHVQLDPIAVLPTGATEIREACVVVSDQFAKTIASERS